MAQAVLKNVSKVFEKNIVAVNNVSFIINDKEFVVLVGPSGCGKSTILRMIAGLEEITSGEIFIGDRLVNDASPKDRDIAMVFQNYALYPHMSVFQNMAFGLKLRKYPKKEIEQRVSEAAEILGITNLLERKPKALSGGQRQRVAVGRAIVRKPKVFLFDEPLSNLDAKLRVQMRTEIAKLHKRIETTMVYVTHDQVEAMTMGDRIVVMKDGIVHQIDTPLQVYNYPKNKFVAGFIGSPAMNFIDGRIIRNNGLFFKANAVELKIPGRISAKLENYIDQAICFGIRPEDIDETGRSQNRQDISQVESLVEVVEPMGNETFVYLRNGTHSFVARIDARQQPVDGTTITLEYDMSKAHFFDVKTEQTIA